MILIALLVGLMLKFGEVLIYLDQTLDIWIPHYSVVFLNNIVAVFMVLHCGLLWVNGFRNICISWRKALRNIWKISNRTHCNLVAMLSDSEPLEQRLVQIFKKFIDKALMYGSIKTSKVNYCKSGNIRGTLIFANFAEIQQARIQKPAKIFTIFCMYILDT